MSYIIFMFLVILFLFKRRKYTNLRLWATEHAVLPYAKVNGDKVEIHNIRNFSYTNKENYKISYYNRNFSLSKLISLDFIVEPFMPGAAHSFLSFGFSDGKHMAISVEARRKKGTDFSPIKALLRWYQIIYVAVDERDIISLRAEHRKNKVYIYPIKLSSKRIQKIFIDMIKKINRLNQKPEYYNLVTNNCVTSVVQHINRVLEKKISYNFDLLFTTFFDKRLYAYDLIKTNLPLSKIRSRYLVNRRLKEIYYKENFEEKIRL